MTKPFTPSGDNRGDGVCSFLFIRLLITDLLLILLANNLIASLECFALSQTLVRDCVEDLFILVMPCIQYSTKMRRNSPTRWVTYAV